MRGAARGGRPLDDVLVVGFGFLGRRVARSLHASGYRVRVVTASLPASGWADVPIVIGDAADHDAVVEAIESCQAVVWCAGRLLPASKVEALARIDDVGPLHTVLTELGLAGGRQFIFLSSGGTVYGDAPRSPTPETETLRPISIYGATKVRCEKYVWDLSDQLGLAATVLRCGNVYGPGQRAGRSQGVVANALACHSAGRPLEIFADPDATRDYIYVDDVVEVIQACLVTPAPRVMNVATGVGTSLIDLIELIRGLTGGPDVVLGPPRDVDVIRNVLDISRLRTFLPTFAPIGLERGLELTAAERDLLVKK